MTVDEVKALLNELIAAKFQRDSAIKEAYVNYNAAVAAAAVTSGTKVEMSIPQALEDDAIVIGFDAFWKIEKLNSDEFICNNYGFDYAGYHFSACGGATL